MKQFHRLERLLHPRQIAGLGWLPQHPDHRDLRFDKGVAPSQFPDSVDLRTTGFLPAIEDQGQLGSCTSQGISASVAYAMNRQRLPPLGPANLPSRLMIYYGERVIENSVGTDSGATIRDGIKVVANVGVCDESLWPYDITQFTVAPPPSAYDAARHNLVSSYMAVTQTEDGLKSALAAGYVVVLGFSVFESFMSPQVAESGIAPLPAPNEAMVGGHAVVVVGYTAQGEWIVRNSWGSAWGQAGYFTMPFDYLTNPNLASDLWVIELLTRTALEERNVR
jgi:C1A family cysteine protease